MALYFVCWCIDLLKSVRHLFMSFLNFCLIKCLVVTGCWYKGTSTLMFAVCINLWLKTLRLMHLFVQSVSSPTHNGGRTLDLVLTRGFPVHICEIFDAGISDHYPVVFEPVISYDQPILSLPVHYSCAFHANTALKFCEPYSKFFSNSNAPLSSCMDAEQLVEILNSACCTGLNAVAPLRRKKVQGQFLSSTLVKCIRSHYQTRMQDG